MPHRYTVRFHLRAATRAAHDDVDGHFGGYDLADRSSYARFLTAHARVVPSLEQVLDAGALWPEWRARGRLLLMDLAELDVARPDTVAVSLDDDGAGVRWGMLYVLEGSRLGGAMLAQRVGPGMPARYLGAAHQAGSWARFGAAIEAAGAQCGPDWLAEAVHGANRAFGLFAGVVPRNTMGRGVVGAAGIEPATPPV